MNQRRHLSSGLLLLPGIILALVSTLAAYGAEIGSPPELRFQGWPDSRLPARPAAPTGRFAPTALDPSIWISPPALDGATDEPRNGALEVVQRRDAHAVRRYRQGFFQRFRFSGEWIDRAGKEGLGISNLDTALTLAIPLGTFENLLLVTPAFGVDYSAGPTDVDVPPRLYNTGVDLMWRKQFNDRWGSMVAVRPAVASDFRTGWDTIRVTGRVLATWQWVPERLSLLFGVVYLDRNDIPMLPGAGLIWTPSPDWRLDLIFPRPRLARRLVFVPHEREDWLYLGGSLGGRTWSIKRQSGGADQGRFANQSLLALRLEQHLESPLRQFGNRPSFAIRAAACSFPGLILSGGRQHYNAANVALLNRPSERRHGIRTTSKPHGLQTGTSVATIVTATACSGPSWGQRSGFGRFPIAGSRT